MQLTERVDQWRMTVQTDSSKKMQAILTAIPCLRVPISSFDNVQRSMAAATTDGQPSEYYRSEARESTDVFLLPNWVDVRTDDELRRGRYTDNNGNVVPYRYTVDGIREYGTFGYQDMVAVFCSSLE